MLTSTFQFNSFSIKAPFINFVLGTVSSLIIVLVTNKSALFSCFSGSLKVSKLYYLSYYSNLSFKDESFEGSFSTVDYVV